MSKTHWVAGLFVIAQALEAAGVIPAGITDSVNAVLTVLLGGTVTHRVLKETGVVGGAQ